MSSPHRRANDVVKDILFYVTPTLLLVLGWLLRPVILAVPDIQQKQAVVTEQLGQVMLRQSEQTETLGRMADKSSAMEVRLERLDGQQRLIEVQLKSVDGKVDDLQNETERQRQRGNGK